MLYQGDPGFGTDNGKKPAGFLKLEIKGSTGLLTSLVHNLRDLREEGLVYKGFIGSTGASVLVNIGTIPVDGRGRGESRWRFDPEDVAGTGYGIDSFNVFGVMVFGNSKKNTVCPLMGHTGKLAQDWKALFNKKGAKDDEYTEAEAVAQEKTDQWETVVTKEPAEAPKGPVEPPEQPPIGYAKASPDVAEKMQAFPEEPGQPGSNCRWWRINRYNYLFGIMYDDSGAARYYIYGIPGVYNTQAHMQMEAYGFCKWRPQKGEGNRSGDCGYWLAFVDSRTGVLANPDL